MKGGRASSEPPPPGPSPDGQSLHRLRVSRRRWGLAGTTSRRRRRLCTALRIPLLVLLHVRQLRRSLLLIGDPLPAVRLQVPLLLAVVALTGFLPLALLAILPLAFALALPALVRVLLVLLLLRLLPLRPLLQGVHRRALRRPGLLGAVIVLDHALQVRVLLVPIAVQLKVREKRSFLHVVHDRRDTVPVGHRLARGFLVDLDRALPLVELIDPGSLELRPKDPETEGKQKDCVWTAVGTVIG